VDLFANRSMLGVVFLSYPYRLMWRAESVSNKRIIIFGLVVLLFVCS